MRKAVTPTPIGERCQWMRRDNTVARRVGRRGGMGSTADRPHLAAGAAKVWHMRGGDQLIAMDMRNSALVLFLPRRDLRSSMASTTFMSERTLRRR